MTALPELAGASPRYGISFSLSGQNYGMGAARDYLGAWATRQNASGAPADGSVEEKDWNRGVSGGVRVMAHRDIVLTAEYTMLSGRASIRMEPRFSFYTFDPYGAEIDLSAHAYTATVAYLPLSWRSFRVGGAAGVGYYVSKGEWKDYVDGGGSNTSDWRGRGTGVHALALAETRRPSPWGIQIATGYRSAKTSRLEENGNPVRASDGGDVNLDWSGFVASVGLFVDFGR